jgi:hypothetical protein
MTLGLPELILVSCLGFLPLIVVVAIIYSLLRIMRTVERAGRTLDEIAVALRNRN